MNIQILSDLHLELYDREIYRDFFPSINLQADVIILAGDIESGDYSLLVAQELSQKFGKYVIWTPGNHEFYGRDYVEQMQRYKKTKENKNLSIGMLLGMGFDGSDESDCVVYHNGVRFVGGPLWSDFALYRGSNRMPTVSKAMEEAESRIKDFYSIFYNGEQFTPKIAAEINLATRTALVNILSQPFDGISVGITHFSPSEESIPIRWRPDSRMLNSVSKLPNENVAWMLNPYFSSNCEDALKLTDFWIHGHNHHSVNYVKGNAQVVANPRGYCRNKNANIKVFENENFDPGFLLNINKKKNIQKLERMKI